MVAPVISAAASAALRKMVEQMAKKKAKKEAGSQQKTSTESFPDRITGSRAAKDYKENAKDSRTKEVSGELRFREPRRDPGDYDRTPRMSDDMKKGGKVKAKKYAKGGSIDGCAIKGKTKGKVI